MKKIRRWLFCKWWIFKNRHWKDTRQKRKAMKKDLERWLSK